jgi:hypothetical protein
MRLMFFPSSRPARLLLVSLLLGSSLAGCQRRDGSAERTPTTTTTPPTASAPAPQVETGAPVIDFDARVHDFGTVNEGTVLKHQFAVRNQGNAPLVLSGVSTSCGCTAAAPASDTIPPSGSAPIEVTFNSRGFSGAGSKTIRVGSNDRQHPTSVLEIKYNIERFLVFPQPAVQLTAAVGKSAVETIWVDGKLAGKAKLRVVRVEGGEKQVVARIVERRQNGQVQKGLEVKLKGKKAGAGHGDLTIETGLPNPAELPLRVDYTVS